MPYRQDKRLFVAVCWSRLWRCDRWYGRYGHWGPRRQSGDPEDERPEVHVSVGTCQLCAPLSTVLTQVQQRIANRDQQMLVIDLEDIVKVCQ